MRKFTFQTAWRMKLGNSRVEPHPFPGHYPTRIAWNICFKNGKNLFYCGKPTYRVALEFHKLLLDPTATWVTAVEFDQKHAITTATRPLPQQAQFILFVKKLGIEVYGLTKTSSCSRLMNVYHPFPEYCKAGMANSALGLFLDEVPRQLLTLRGKKIWSYFTALRPVPGEDAKYAVQFHIDKLWPVKKLAGKEVKNELVGGPPPFLP